MVQLMIWFLVIAETHDADIGKKFSKNGNERYKILLALSLVSVYSETGDESPVMIT